MVQPDSAFEKKKLVYQKNSSISQFPLHLHHLMKRKGR